MRKIRINNSHDSGPGKAMRVYTKAQPIEIETDPATIAKPIADAIAQAIAAGIRGTSATNKSGKKSWNRTGRLASGLTVEKVGERYEVRAPSDRLQDPAMVAALAEDVPELARPLDPPRVQQQLEETTRDLVTVKKF